MPQELQDYDDIGEAVRERRPLRPSHHYRFLLAKGDLRFEVYEVNDPVPLGTQILRAAHLDADDDWILVAVLHSGDFDDVPLDQPFDLRDREAERFVAFQTDRLFKLKVDGREIDWGKPAITAKSLYDLAVPGPDMAVFLEVRGGPGRLVEPGELIDLTAPGIERFVTAPRPQPRYEIFVNSRERIVTGRRVTFGQIVQIAFPTGQAPNVAYSMTFNKAASSPHSGELADGGSVDVKNGTIFNVTRTVQS